MRPILCMNFFFGQFPLHEFFFGHFPLHEFFWGFFPTPPPPHHFSNGPSLISVKPPTLSSVGVFFVKAKNKNMLSWPAAFNYNYVNSV